jgi:uncharacterized membrane protein YadS
MTKTRSLAAVVIALFVVTLVSICILHWYHNYDFELMTSLFSILQGMLLGWLIRKDKEERDIKWTAKGNKELLSPDKSNY